MENNFNMNNNIYPTNIFNNNNMNNCINPFNNAMPLNSNTYNNYPHYNNNFNNFNNNFLNQNTNQYYNNNSLYGQQNNFNQQPNIQYQNNPNTMYGNNMNQNNNNNPYVTNGVNMLPKKNDDNNIGHQDNKQLILETPTGETSEVENYFKKWGEEKIEDEKIKKELKKQQTAVYSHEEKFFKYSNFNKAPTTFIYQIGENSNTFTYLTTVLHCLGNLPPLAKYYLKNKKFFVNNMFKCPFNYYFSRFISNIYSFPEPQDQQFYQKFSIINFKNFVIKRNKMFQGNSTKDAENFLIFFLERLHEELNRLKNEKNINKKKNDFKEYYKDLLKNNDSIIFDCFNWVQKKKQICVINHQSVDFNNFFTCQLDIKKYTDYIITKNLSKKYSVKISDLIEYFLTPKDDYNTYCVECQKKTKNNIRNFISISPNYFIFITGLRDKYDVLDNFKPQKKDGSGGELKFEIEKEIDLGKIISTKSDDITPDLQFTFQHSHKIYQLDGLISYNFDEEDNKKICYYGYYRSHIDKSWYLYSYNGFKKIEEEYVLKTSGDSLFPAILIYSHK